MSNIFNSCSKYNLRPLTNPKCNERLRDFFSLDFRYNFSNIFNIISKSFATYGCCHPCSSYNHNLLNKDIQKYYNKKCFIIGIKYFILKCIGIFIINYLFLGK